MFAWLGWRVEQRRALDHPRKEETLPMRIKAGVASLAVRASGVRGRADRLQDLVSLLANLEVVLQGPKINLNLPLSLLGRTVMPCDLMFWKLQVGMMCGRALQTSPDGDKEEFASWAEAEL